MSILPVKLNVASTAACHPNVYRLLIIKSFDPIDNPKMKRRQVIVSEIDFSVFCKSETFLNA